MSPRNAVRCGLLAFAPVVFAVERIRPEAHMLLFVMSVLLASLD